MGEESETSSSADVGNDLSTSDEATDTEEPTVADASVAPDDAADAEASTESADGAEVAPPIDHASTADGGVPATDADPEDVTFDDDFDDDFDDLDADVLEGPAEDEEMPLADHIQEMVRRTAVVFFVAGIVTLVAFPLADQMINFLWNSHIPGAAEVASRRPRVYGPLELILTELKVAGLAGIVVGLPVFVYQTYRFMRPGLFPRERRYYLAAVPTSLVLALVGVAFAHFVVLPVIFAYFTSYTVGTAVIAFGLRETFNLILILMGYMAIVFQIPLFVMLAVMMGLVTRRWLADRRLIFWGSFLGLAFLVSPDPTGMAPIIVAATMIVLFEGTLALLKWTNN